MIPLMLVAVSVFFIFYVRNPDLTKDEIEHCLRDYLGVNSVLWLAGGVVGDVDTDGHIDNLLSFVRPGEVRHSTKRRPFCASSISYTRDG